MTVPAETVGEAQVDLVMGSGSDWKIVDQAVTTLEGFGIDYDTRILSAHRTYEELDEYAAEVRASRFGLVIVTFAGMAAALGGDMAARVPNAVIGVPIESKVDTQNSAVGAQIGMPPGSGLTIVGPNQGVNGALAAVRQLTHIPAIRDQLLAYQAAKRDATVADDEELQAMGWKAWSAKQLAKEQAKAK